MQQPQHSIDPAFALAGILAPFVGLSACGLGDAPGDHEEHGEIEHVELWTRGESGTPVAEWSHDGGWLDADGEPIDELPPSVVDDGSLAPLEVGGAHASLAVRFLDHDGDRVEMATASQDEVTGERECTEDSVRYFPLDNETDVIAWPPIAHPDSADGSTQFVELESGEVAGIFNCDHVDIHPESEGTADLEFVLWHDDHGDDATDALTVRVGASE